MSLCDRRRETHPGHQTNRDLFSFPTTAPSRVRPATRESLSQNGRRVWLSRHRLRLPPKIREDRGNDEQKVREVFTHELLAFFEAEEGISAEGSGDQLIFYRGGERISPEDVRPFMEEGLQVFRLFRQ